jgi:serine/threonine protein kinase
VIELLTGAPPYFDLGPMTALFKIVEDQLPPFPEGVSEELNDFLAKCFDRDAGKRPSAKELLDHPFMKTHIKSAEAPILDLEQATGTIRMHNQDTLRRRPAVFDMAWAPSGDKPKAPSGPPDGIRPLATAGTIMRRPSVRLDSPPVISSDDIDSARREKDRVESNVEGLRRQLTTVKQECERLNKEEADLLTKLDSQYTTQSNLQKRKIQLMKLVSGLSHSHDDLKLLDTALDSLQRRFGKDRVERLLGTATARVQSKEKRAVASSSSPTLRRTKSTENL